KSYIYAWSKNLSKFISKSTLSAKRFCLFPGSVRAGVDVGGKVRKMHHFCALLAVFHPDKRQRDFTGRYLPEEDRQSKWGEKIPTYRIGAHHGPPFILSHEQPHSV